MPKFRKNNSIQRYNSKKIPGQKVGWKDRRKDGKMDRPYFIGP